VERVYLGLGSNRGDSEAILQAAVARLAVVLTSLRVSSTWRSAARYVVDQPPFVNLVVEALTDLNPRELLTRTMEIEAEFGRDRSLEQYKGPRSLDIDLLLFGELHMDDAKLTIPHPGMADRKFVLLPLVELAPELRHPTTGVSFMDALARLPPQAIYRIVSPSYAAVAI
jgi:2-amino-4-hydroxy-6-hydroxymethyldihydropteridine diphosphokinase